MPSIDVGIIEELDSEGPRELNTEIPRGISGRPPEKSAQIGAPDAFRLAFSQKLG
mgnify:CR=1 FL=1